MGTLRVGTSLIILGFLSACTDVTTTVQRQGVEASAKPKDYTIQIFREAKPPGPYETLGKVETHVQRNFFAGGGVQLEEAYQELRQKGCGLGGDGIIIDHVIETKATENTHIHVWATVIRTGK